MRRSSSAGKTRPAQLPAIKTNTTLSRLPFFRPSPSSKIHPGEQRAAEPEAQQAQLGGTGLFGLRSRARIVRGGEETRRRHGPALVVRSHERRHEREISERLGGLQVPLRTRPEWAALEEATLSVHGVHRGAV